jgi:hypothetical protein
MRHRFRLAGLLAAAAVASCATTQSRFVPLGQTYPSRGEHCQIDVLKTGTPGRDFVRISRIDVHIEKTHFIRSGFDDALPELKRQACLSGADAVIEIRDRSTATGETEVYHVTATGITYR